MPSNLEEPRYDERDELNGKRAQPLAPVHEDEDEEEGGGPVKSFLEHLEDLRWVIIKGGSALIVAMVVCLIAAPRLTALMLRPMERAGIRVELVNPGQTNAPAQSPDSLTATNAPATQAPSGDSGAEADSKIHPIKLELLSPIGGFMLALRLAFYFGIVFALPAILYFIGTFIVPALKKKEKKFLLTAFTIGTGFFLLGVVVCYYVVLPLSLRALLSYNAWMGFTSEIWRAEDYFQFATKFMLGVGLIFEVPIVILTLIRLDLVTHEMLLKGRRYMIAVNFVFCAAITPADLVTTFLMAMALQICYEICLLISAHWQRQRLAAIKAAN